MNRLQNGNTLQLRRNRKIHRRALAVVVQRAYTRRVWPDPYPIFQRVASGNAGRAGPMCRPRAQVEQRFHYAIDDRSKMESHSNGDDYTRARN